MFVERVLFVGMMLVLLSGWIIGIVVVGLFFLGDSISDIGRGFVLNRWIVKFMILLFGMVSRLMMLVIIVSWDVCLVLWVCWVCWVVRVLSMV